MYTNPVYCTDVHKTSLLYRRGMYRGQTLQMRGMYRGQTLQVRGMYRYYTHKTVLYRCSLNQFTVQVYTGYVQGCNLINNK